MSDMTTAIVMLLMAAIFLVMGFSIGKEVAYKEVIERCIKDNQSSVYADVMEKCNYVIGK